MNSLQEQVTQAKKSNLCMRIVTGVPMALGAIGFIWSGSTLFTLLVMLVVFYFNLEFSNFIREKNYHPHSTLALVCSFALVLTASYAPFEYFNHAVIASFCAVIISFVCGKDPTESVLVNAATTFLCVIYCGVFPAYIVILRNMENSLYGGNQFGLAIVILLLIVCAATDVGAYATGKLIGSHKLCPSISPAKTIEGALGGMAFAVFLGYWTGVYFGLPVMHTIILSLGGSVIGQIGDLWESCLKRDVGCKDSGQLIKGHGGALDRCDSYLLSAPVYYLYVSWFFSKMP